MLSKTIVKMDPSPGGLFLPSGNELTRRGVAFALSSIRQQLCLNISVPGLPVCNLI